MKRIILLSFLMSFTNTVHAGIAEDWQGTYTMYEDVELEGHWGGNLTVEACADLTCKFSYSAGSEQSDCSADGSFKITAPGKAQYTTTAEDPAAGSCTLTFEHRKNQAVFVDSHGECNSLCGMQGARYFGLEFAKRSSKKFLRTSFSCFSANTLSKIETEICTDPQLAKLDLVLDSTFRSARAKAPKEATKMKTAQSAWLKGRNRTCEKAKSLVACLQPMYEARIKELQ